MTIKELKEVLERVGIGTSTQRETIKALEQAILIIEDRERTMAALNKQSQRFYEQSLDYHKSLQRVSASAAEQFRLGYNQAVADLSNPSPVKP